VGHSVRKLAYWGQPTEPEERSSPVRLFIASRMAFGPPWRLGSGPSGIRAGSQQAYRGAERPSWPSYRRRNRRATTTRAGTHVAGGPGPSPLLRADHLRFWTLAAWASNQSKASGSWGLDHGGCFPAAIASSMSCSAPRSWPLHSLCPSAVA